MEQIRNCLSILTEAIGYPEVVPAGTTKFTYIVDDVEVRAQVESERLILSQKIAVASEIDLAEFANFAAGRVLKEEAVLAYDAEEDALMLWQDIPQIAEAAVLRRFFETFVASCDWWRARVGGASSQSMMPEMVIRP